MSDSDKPVGSAPVVVEPHALVAHQRRNAITLKALGSLDRQWAIEFFATHPQAREAFIAAVSTTYPLSETMIARYADQCCFVGELGIVDLSYLAHEPTKGLTKWLPGSSRQTWGLSCNEVLPWSSELISRYEDQWDWERLSWNEGLPWSAELIGRYEDQWDWERLSWNEGLPWSAELIGRYEDQWDWERLSWNEGLPWSAESISRYEDRWDWGRLSGNEALPWSAELISRYEDRWNWVDLSANEGLPWSAELFGRYEDRWGWEGLSYNGGLPWSAELIGRYEDRWDWQALSGTEGLPWSAELIARFKDRWDWIALSENNNLPWSAELIARYANRWDWKRLGLIQQLPRIGELIERYHDRWDWRTLGWNRALPWSESLIGKYKDRWTWTCPIFRERLGGVIRHWSERDICAVMDRSALCASEQISSCLVGIEGDLTLRARTPDPLVQRLLRLIAELTEESAGYLDREDDLQLWYNRGYANGMVAALRDLGHADAVAKTVPPDPYDSARDQQLLPWGKAYEHGREMGERETHEVFENDSGASGVYNGKEQAESENEQQELVEMVKAESARLAETEFGPGQKEQEMIALWRAQRPKMVARLENLGILEEFAHLLEMRRFQAETANLKAGMGWPDSREQANLDWLITDPETDDEEQEDELNAMLERLTQAPRERLPWETRRQGRTGTENRGRSVVHQVLDATVKGLIEMPYDETLSGEGSGLETVWDEICAQVQVEHSIYWDAYVATMRAYLEGSLDELTAAEKDEIMPDATADELIDVLMDGLLLRAAAYEYGQSSAPASTEPMSVSEIQALNTAAMTLLEREASRVPEGLPPLETALLHLARWGMEKLPLVGILGNRQEEMEAMLLSLERQAQRDPNGAVAALAVGEAGETLLRPSDLGETLDSAASAVLHEMAMLVERWAPTSGGD